MKMRNALPRIAHADLTMGVGRLVSYFFLLLTLLTPPAYGAWYGDTGWLNRQKITINSSVTPSTLTDFPYLVKIVDVGNPLFSKAQTNGNDILFTSSDGSTKLAHEIEYYNGASGEIWVWVKIPSLSSASNTDIYLYYGNNSAPNQENVASVWSNGYAAVYHLHGDFGDSLGSHPGSNTGSLNATGRIADGRDFVPQGGVDAVSLGTWNVSGSALTIQSWINPDTFTQDDPRVISKATDTTTEGHVWMLSLTDGSSGDNRLRARLKTGTSDTAGTTTLIADAGSGDLSSVGQWFHAAMTYDGSTMRIVKDGLDVGSTAKTGSIRENGWDGMVGNNPNNASQSQYSWDGKLDEVRISSVARSVNWLTAEYRNQGTPATYQTLQSEETIVVISGTVFEDVNYGGGAGRTLAASSGAGVTGARVELFSAAGDFITFTNTGAGGTYTFSVTGQSNYTVRVVNSSVLSTRPGSVAGLLPVQTFRTTATNATVVAVTDYVGGEVPHKADAGNGSTTLAALTTGTTAPQSITDVTLTTNSVSGLEFGFNFDTIVNTNNTGQGSLSQFITNANTLGNAGLSQVGQTAGKEVSIFMISDGSAHSGLRSGIANQLTAGVARIVPATVLPTITGADTTLDGTTQTANVGNNNPAVLGTGGSVGVDGLALGQVDGPEVEIRGNASLANGVQVQANNVTIRGLGIHGFGAVTADAIRVSSGATGALVENNVLGSLSTSFTDPGSGLRNYDGVDSDGATGGTIRNNLIGFVARRGVFLQNNSTGWIVDNNEIRDSGLENADGDGIAINQSVGSFAGNLIVGTSSQGVVITSASGNTFTNNTVSGNGVGIPASVLQSAGIALRSTASGTVFERNVISGNYGAGLAVNNGATGIRITRNLFFDNGTITARTGAGATTQIGIDLNTASDDSNLGTSPYVTTNAPGARTGGNNLLNFPVLDQAVLSSTNLLLSGWAKSGSVMEFFIPDGDGRNFGEGKTYLVSLTEGSGSDTDSSSSTYGPGLVNGLAQGTDTTSRFAFSIAIPGGVSLGTKLTATATDGSGNSSEFSGVATVASINADVQTTKAGATNVVAGSNLVYTITVTNLGPSTASNVVVLDIIPTNSIFVSATSGGSYSNGVVTWSSLTNFANAASTNFTVTVTAPASGSITNTVSSTASTSDPDPSNNNGSAASARVISTITASADVQTTKTGSTNVLGGDNLVYTITVTNLGPSTASNVVVLDIIPTNSVFVSATGGGSFSGGVVTWNGFTNFAAATGTNFTVTVTAPSMDGSMTNIVSSTADTPDPDYSNNDGSAAGARVITTVTLSGVNVTGWVYLDANRNGFKDGSEAGTGLSLYAKLIAGTNTPGPALQAVTVDGGSGLYTFTNVIASAYNIVIDDNSTLADVTPALPSGWTGTEMSGQMRTNVVVVSVSVPNQNFGLANSVTLSGRVFKDTGGGGSANDGILDGAEEAIPGAAVKLTDSSGATTYDTATTDGSGRYTLHIPGTLANGTELKVVETNPGGHLSTGASAGNTGGSYDRPSDTLTFTLTSGTVYAEVNFGDVPENSFVAAGQQTGPPGSFVVMAHSYTAGSAGQLAFATANVSTPSVVGWNAVVYRDANCNGILDAGEPVISAPITVTAGEKICLVVKEFIPLAAPMNARDQLTVTANLTYSGATPALTNAVALTDLTTVGLATTVGLTLHKAVDKETALPGEVITYTITYENRGAEALGNVIIYDQTPAFTTFLSAANGTLPAGLASVATLTPTVGEVGAVRWTFTGTLGPGSVGTISYSVMVRQ